MCVEIKLTLGASVEFLQNWSTVALTFTYPLRAMWHMRPPHIFRQLPRSYAAALTSFHDLHPAHVLSALAILLHVVVSVPLFLFPSGDHGSATPQLLSCPSLVMCLTNIHHLQVLPSLVNCSCVSIFLLLANRCGGSSLIA